MRRSLNALVVTALLMAALAVAPNSRATSRQVPALEREALEVVSTGASRSPREVKRFWTHRRMMRARPVLPDSAERTVQRVSPDEIPPEPTDLAEPALPSTAAQGQNGPTPQHLSSPVSSSLYTQFPYKTVGKVFFTNAGDPYVCSGAAVNSDNRSVVWTAGHCLYSEETESWVDNWVFVPRYQAGLSPKGEWPLYEGWVPHRWFSHFDNGLDSAAVVVAPQGDPLVDSVGGLGFRTGASYTQNFLALGYPAATPFDGESMVSCLSPTVDHFSTEYGAVVGMACDMTGGSSGGPWIVENSYLNSNISFGFVDTPWDTYGPYFGTAASSLYEAAESFAVPGYTPPPLPPDTTPPSITASYARPNPFSPNGDGRRDKTWIYWTVSEAADVVLRIDNRFGREVYSLEGAVEEGSYADPWNGRTTSGSQARNGTYTYTLSATDASGNAAAIVSGTVTVRR